MLNLPSMSWLQPYDHLESNAPKISTGHSAVLVPSLGGICLFGGVRSNVPRGSGTLTRLSRDLYVLGIRPARPPLGEPKGPKLEAAGSGVGSSSQFGGDPERWTKLGGAFLDRDEKEGKWPPARCGHACVALAPPYRWADGKAFSTGAMLLFGGYTVDQYLPDGPEGALSDALFLLRPGRACG